ncbi:MAG: sulfite exporter TauE/SafE family protein [SAR202 cluster bacterium]|nr:sulfite exporter TauE/SafE family protein [SAR202 cluster bacterium]
MEWTVLLIGIAIVLFGATLQGTIGFGLALTAVPLLSIMASPKLVVPALMILGTLSSLYLTYRARRSIDLKMVWPLVAGGVAGIPIGTYLLLSLDEDTLRLFVGVVVAVFAVLLLAGVHRKVRAERRASALIGLASGVLNGSISISGPPIVLFFANQRIPRDVFRGTMVAYFTIVNVAAIIVFSATGLVNATTLRDVGVLLPAVLAGVALGQALSTRVPERAFRTIALVMVACGGVVASLSGAGVV